MRDKVFNLPAITLIFHFPTRDWKDATYWPVDDKRYLAGKWSLQEAVNYIESSGLPLECSPVEIYWR